MYNGVGVKTARGTGTSGHVSRNLGSLRPVRHDVRKLKEFRERESQVREPDPAILHHNALRQIEVQLLELRDKLEDEYVHPSFLLFVSICRDLSESEIEERLSVRRTELRQSLDDQQPAKSTPDSHTLLVETENHNAQLAEAFGVRTTRREEDDPHRLAEEEARKILLTTEISRSRSPQKRRHRSRSRSSSPDSIISPRRRSNR